MSAVPETAPPPPPGWEGILDPGERILWQGRPAPGIVLTAGNAFAFLFGLGFAGFALFWMIGAAKAGAGFWAFGLIHFSVGLGMAAGALLWAPYRRRYTWYTLSDQRAFIATEMPHKGKALNSYPVTPQTVLRLADGAPGNVWFAEETRRGKNRTYTVDIGFERIADADHVYRLMRDIQRGHE